MSVTSRSRALASKAPIIVTGPHKPDSEGQQELDETIRIIKAHLLSRHRESSIGIKVDHKSRHFGQVTQFLDRTGVRYDIDDQDILFIYAMPSSIHQSLGIFAVSCLNHLKNEILIPEEARNLEVGVTSLRLSGKIKGKGTKRQASKKTPDQTFFFRDPQTHCRYRTVIFEAGFSETHDDLVRDMKQWLLHSRGEVQLVILADINEDKKQLLKQQKSETFRDHAAKVLKDFGNPLGRRKHTEILMADNRVYQGDRARDISALVERLHHEIDDVVQVEDWIGPITADLELWVLKDSEPYRRGRARVFPGLTGRLPPIYTGDIIPLSCQGSFPNFDASRKLYLDLEEFRCCLLDGIRDDAVERAYDFACPNSEDDEEEDHQE
ncbi:hypothetical protein P168DRAFT_293326 [Aspergillus campestris IBT 28561]|uniref:Uncharacterized protein n=1 Tax=Aspergillus campestris (strain IBT 28561) TaxID=1392248 RepID=A0A2I1CTI5_ASPC2|nr:uncharacterized protein P168DRAFT_293326 [Aspergillus campestris IBT 28561]PKY00943.1 hypothetical protein P168DRAFT_293326 [Aspergillus campestris IBT 28561]